MRSKIVLLLAAIVGHGLAQETIVLQPGPEGKDAVISTRYTQNIGDYPNLFALGWTGDGLPFVTRSLMDFDLSAIPTDVYIVSARLSLFFAINEWNPGLYQTTGNQAYLRKIITPWEEDAVNWDTQPEFTSDLEVILPESTDPAQNYTDVDVTELIKDRYLNPDSNLGMIFMLDDEYPYHGMCFASSDYMEDTTLRPILTITYTMCEPPTASFEYQVDSLTVNFAGFSPTSLTWHWDFGDGDSSSIQNPVHTYLEQGFYEVCLTITDSCYFDEYCETIEICTGPPEGGFTYNAEGLAVYFQDTSSAAGEYYWDLGDGNTSTLRNPIHYYEYPGIYTVCQYVSNSCGSDTTCETLDLCALPVAEYYYYIDYLTVYFEDYSIYAEEYYWNFGDGYTSYQQYPVHTYPGIGIYKATLTTSNQCGSDSTYEYIDLYVGVTEAAEPSFSIYPNPATGLINILSSYEGIVQLHLVNLQGLEMMRREVKLSRDGKTILDISDRPSGIYFLRLIGDKFLINRKIIIL